MKAKYVKYEHDGKIGKEQWHFFCPGCGYIHAVSPQVHTFNGDFDKPSFSPSVLCNWNKDKICHSFVKDGFIQYLGDCFHELKNKTVELPELTEDMR